MEAAESSSRAASGTRDPVVRPVTSAPAPSAEGSDSAAIRGARTRAARAAVRGPSREARVGDGHPARGHPARGHPARGHPARGHPAHGAQADDRPAKGRRRRGRKTARRRTGPAEARAVIGRPALRGAQDLANGRSTRVRGSVARPSAGRARTADPVAARSIAMSVPRNVAARMRHRWRKARSSSRAVGPSRRRSRPDDLPVGCSSRRPAARRSSESSSTQRRSGFPSSRLKAAR